MRKFISIIFISVFCSNAVLAAIVCPATSPQAECGAGCVYSTLGCYPCDPGTYTDESGSTSCSACDDPPVGASFSSSPGTSKDKCPWIINCSPGKYYASGTGCTQCPEGTFTIQPTIIKGTGGSASTNNQCIKCGKKSVSNEGRTNCKCIDNHHIKGQDNDVTEDNGATECVPNTYTITYMSDNGSTTKQDGIEHGSSVTTLTEAGSGFTKTGYYIEYWKLDKPYTEYKPGNSTLTVNSNITLTAQWEKKKFTVTYDVGDATNCGLTSPQECEYENSECTAKTVNTCIHPGHTFRGWSCTSGCNSGGTIGIGTDISKLSDGNNMTLKANWQECFIGHYCPGIFTNPIPCPAGSTSAARSDEQTDCYMTGNQTVICDNNKCFQLPGGAGNIFYHGK